MLANDGKYDPARSFGIASSIVPARVSRTGLTVGAELDSAAYPKGIKISDRQVKDLEQRALRRHQFHGEWNYRLIPVQGP